MPSLDEDEGRIGLELRRVAALMQEPKILVDGRNVLEPAAARDAGLLYRGYGRGRLCGQPLCERLLSEGYRVVCMDNLRSGSLENLSQLHNEVDF